MNGNDLLKAMSDLDPKYIDEAAFELQKKPEEKKKAGLFSLKKSLYVAIPAAAVLFLTVFAIYPAINRMNDNNSAAESAGPASEAAETAAEAPAEAAAEAADEEAAAEATYEEADSAYEEALPSELNREKEVQTPTEAMDSYEAAEAPMSDEAAIAGEEAAAAQSLQSESLKATGAAPAEAGADNKNEAETGLNKATYDKGILTINLSSPLAIDPEKITYILNGRDADGLKKTYASGKLKDILTSGDPLTLDLTSYDLPKGTYYLTFGGETAEFTVE